MAQAVLTASTPGTVKYNNKTHNYNYTFSGADLDRIKLLSTACLITKVTLHIECATNLSNAPSLNYTVYCGSHNYSGSFDFPKDHASDCKREITDIALSGTDVFGSNIASNAYRISYSVGSSIMSLYKYWINTTSITIDYTVRNWVTFKDADGAILRAAHECNINATPTAPQVSVPSGYSFDGWKSSLDDTTYTSVPPCTGADVIYTAVYHKIDYHVGLSAVNSDNTSLDVGNKLTGGGTYQIDDTFSIVADTGDTTVAGNTFLFDYWTFRDANGNDMFLDDSGKAAHFENEALSSLEVTATTIPSWWSAPAASGDHQGEFWIYGIAHYYQVYDISLNIGDPSDGDPAGVGKNGIVSISVVSDGTTQTYTKDQVLTGSIVARVANPAVQINTTFTAANEYEIFSTAFYGVPSGSTEYTKSWQGAAYVVSGTVTTSNWYFQIRAWKRYFDLNISGDTDGVLKVYSVASNGARSLISPTHIPRTTKVEIEADGELMLQKTHDTAVTSISPNSNASVSGGKGVITSLLQNHTITVARTQVNCTMTKIVDSVESTETVVRSNPYRYIIAAESGWTISSATLTMRGTQIQSWTSTEAAPIESIDYTIEHVTGDCVLTANRVQNPLDYVTIQTPTSSYGTVNVVGATSVLKTEFNGFTVSSVAALPAYEVVTATYRWTVGDATVGTGTINPTTGTTIQYPNATIPGNQDVVLVVEVQYRKNIVYHSHGTGAEFTSNRPQSLWYTPVGQAPQRVVAVYAQTASHPAPILLFGNVE